MKVAPLLLAGLAAFGYYKYSKMSEQEKKDLLNKGKKFMDDNLGGLKDVFGQKTATQAGGGGFSRNNFTQS